MRIVGGRHRGRPLAAPPGRDLRPTADRAREALFNILAHAPFVEEGPEPLDHARVLDVFAGTGALGLEAISRGAAHATFIENNPAALAALRKNIGTLNETARATVLAMDALRLPKPFEPAALALLDPPYRSGAAGPALAGLHERGWLLPGALAVVEVAADEAFNPPSGFTVLEERTYGAARLVFLRAP